MTEPINQVAETIQTASVKHNPSAAYDVNPTPEKRQVSESAISDTDSIPSDVVDPSRMVRTIVRQRNLPPLPDLRFEQSYLASLKDADTWGRVAWITTRDQVLYRHSRIYQGNRKKRSDNRIQVILPLVQGTLWTLALSGWRFWNRNASLSGRTLGSRIRRWWYEVNNWKLPPMKSYSTDPKVTKQMEDVSAIHSSETVYVYRVHAHVNE